MRPNNFSKSTKSKAIDRQNGVCAFCGVSLNTPWTEGDYKGYAHHLKPVKHGGDASISNCVYLCWGDHLLMGHGMSPFGIDNQGGSTDTYVYLSSDDFPFWNNKS